MTRIAVLLLVVAFSSFMIGCSNGKHPPTIFMNGDGTASVSVPASTTTTAPIVVPTSTTVAFLAVAETTTTEEPTTTTTIFTGETCESSDPTITSCGTTAGDSKGWRAADGSCVRTDTPTAKQMDLAEDPTCN